MKSKRFSGLLFIEESRLGFYYSIINSDNFVREGINTARHYSAWVEMNWMKSTLITIWEKFKAFDFLVDFLMLIYFHDEKQSFEEWIKYFIVV